MLKYIFIFFVVLNSVVKPKKLKIIAILFIKRIPEQEERRKQLG